MARAIITHGLISLSLILIAFSANSQNCYLRFYGNGVDDIDRVKIPINSPPSKADVSDDFTIEFKIRANASDNPLGTNANQGYNDDWTLGHIIVDRDIFGDGDYGDYGISLAGNRIAFGVNNGTTSYTLIGGNNIANGQWRYVAVTRQASNGTLQIFIDGTLVASAVTGVTGDISYRDDRTSHPSYPNEPFIVLGAEKHDYDNTTYPSFNGFFDELRISNIVRYTSNYTPQDTFTDDTYTVLLYHFNECNGYNVYDHALMAGAPTDGQIFEGGSPIGPEWSFDGFLWSGSTQGWENPNNWKPTGVPANTDNVVIRPNFQQPIINSNYSPNNPAIIYDLYILNGASLILSNGGTLTVTGQFINNGSLTIKSTHMDNGSLIHNTSGVNATVERYIPAVPSWTTWDAGWHLLSSPVASQSISGAWTPSGSGDDYDFYAWDEVNNQWLNQKVGGNNITTFEVGKGYMVAYQQTKTQEFNGALNVSNVSFSNLSYTPAQGKGWHLLGNPFASPIKWNDGNWSLSNVAGTAKIWNSTSKSYTDISANGIIPMAQGFMVKVNSSTNSLTIPAASRVHDATNWYKSSDVPSLKLIARPADNSSAQEFKLRIEPEATMGYDFYNDSQFLPGYAPQIYAMVEGEKLSTSAVPSLDEGMEISLGFRKTSADAFIIELAENTLPAVVYLKDLKTVLTHNLTQNPVYSFTSAEGDVENRFKLGFASVGIEPREKPAPVVYAVNNVLYLRHLGPKVTVEIYTPAGQLVQRTQTETRELPLDLATGIYLVKVNDGSQVKVEKVFIR